MAGKAQIALDQTLDALENFECTVNLAPNYFDFLLQLGLTHFHLHHQERAKNFLTDSVALFPTAEGHLALGEIALAKGNAALALSHFEIASQADSKAGKEALLKQHELDLPLHPEKYILATGFWDENNHFALTLQNQSKILIQDAVIKISNYNVHKKFLSSNQIKVPILIPIGHEISVRVTLSRPSEASHFKIEIIKTTPS